MDKVVVEKVVVVVSSITAPANPSGSFFAWFAVSLAGEGEEATGAVHSEGVFCVRHCVFR